MGSDELTDTIKLNFDFLKNKKFQWGIVIVLFLFILISSFSIRLSGLPNLVDKTTGHYVFADPDAFYEYRVAAAILSGTSLDSIDPMRNPGMNLTYTTEMLPKALVFVYKIINPLNNSITLDLIDVLYPPVAFAISLIIFFVLCWYLSKSKAFAILASLMLAYSPSFLGRTGVGVSSHEALGIIFFFLALLVYFISLSDFHKKSIQRISLFGIFVGIALGFSFFSWSGGSNFIVMIFPVSSLVYYFFGVNDEKNEKKKFILFNFLWIISSILIMPLFGYSLDLMFGKYLSNFGMMVPFSAIFILVDFLFEYSFKTLKILSRKTRIFYSFVGTFILGFLALFAFGKNPIDLILGIYSQLLHPFGTSRINLTVAYFSQPYLTSLIAQVGSTIFWIFFLGLLVLGFEFARGIKIKKDKLYFILIWIFSISGILFSRYSSSSQILNGVSFISQLFYYSSFLILGGSLIWLYSKEKISVDIESIFLFSWMIIMLISMRSAVRVIFMVVPSIFVITTYFVLKTWKYAINSKEELSKYFFYFVTIICAIVILISVFGNPFSGTAGAYQSLSYSAKNTGSVANQDWQNAMSWVRNNTSPESLFLHWWDYGYLVQTLGNRTTVLDGGNANAYGDHLAARYVLTTPYPETAKSFMKSHNVSYFLIDPTDIGKYSAYSSIGDAENISDRASYLSTFVSDPKETQETINGTTRIYRGGFALDSDLVLTNNNKKSLLPKEGSAIFGFAVHETNQGYAQPIGIYVYNSQQYQAPIRYLYSQNFGLVDFKTGINATIYLYPSVQNQKFDPDGAGIYLSEKTMNSLAVELYLFNDVKNEYPELRLVEESGVYPLNFYYNGFMGPVRIWEVHTDEMEDILVRDEFLRTSGSYGEFDNLTFKQLF